MKNQRALNVSPKRVKGMKPIRILPLGFICIILTGALLLTLPISSAGGEGLSFGDAIFTATSATCVTGLVVVDTGTHFSLFGQIVILIMIQLGGLGFMTVATLLFMAAGKRISLKERMTIAESLGESRLAGIVSLGLRAVKLTFIIEGVGACLLAIRFIPMHGLWKGLWFSVFHSVSAFCNAGFDLIGGYNSFTPFAADPLINLPVMSLIILGGLGFIVLMDIYRNFRRPRLLCIQSKIVLLVSSVLILAGALSFLTLEWGNPETMGNMTFLQKVQASLFQSVTLRTAGFNTIDQNAMHDSSKLISSLLMITGGAPAGTAGGVKVTTLALLILTVRAQIKSRRDTEAFGRRVTIATVRRALCVFLLAFALIIAASLIISTAEYGRLQTEGFLNQLYEIASALGTVGLSVGVTAAASPVTRGVLCLLMFVGRVGFMTAALSLSAGRQDQDVIRFPSADIMVG